MKASISNTILKIVMGFLGASIFVLCVMIVFAGLWTQNIAQGEEAKYDIEMAKQETLAIDEMYKEYEQQIAEYEALAQEVAQSALRRRKLEKTAAK
ncbi:MAG: hypothetical protein GY853_06250 [PVC group bacterium]|nr:hypothetical protein [PVC group bacterium]